MAVVRITLRWLCIVSWGAWVGGFSVYGGVVVPILHAAFDSFEAGGITRKVTHVLNLIGGVALACWLVAATVDRPRLDRLPLALLIGSIGVSVGLLVVQILLHQPMAQMVETGSMDRFYPYHRVYLIVSTTQWVANLIVPACWVIAWTDRPSTGDPS